MTPNEYINFSEMLTDAQLEELGISEERELSQCVVRLAARFGETRTANAALEADNRALREAGAKVAERLVNVARGCRDYGGGHSGKDYENFQHGIETVIRSLEAASKNNPNDTQVNALERMGRQPLAPKEGNAP